MKRMTWLLWAAFITVVAWLAAPVTLTAQSSSASQAQVGPVVDTQPDASVTNQERQRPRNPSAARPKPPEGRPPDPPDQRARERRDPEPERAQPRPPERPRAEPPRTQVYVYGRFGYPYGDIWYPPYWDPYLWYPNQPPYWRYRFPYDRDGSVRLVVSPRQAEVYVNGYAMGLVDDFDGVFQRLRLPPGEYVITCHLDGFENWTRTIFVRPGRDYELRGLMAPLPMGAPEPTRPFPVYPPTITVPPPTEPPVVEPSSLGSVSIRVQPPDAVVIIDGEEWRGSDARRGIVVSLPEGRHHVEIRKTGFLPFSGDIDVRRGETSVLNVSLLPGT